MNVACCGSPRPARSNWRSLCVGQQAEAESRKTEEAEVCHRGRWGRKMSSEMGERERTESAKKKGGFTRRRPSSHLESLRQPSLRHVASYSCWPRLQGTWARLMRRTTTTSVEAAGWTDLGFVHADANPVAQLAPSFPTESPERSLLVWPEQIRSQSTRFLQRRWRPL